MLAVPAVSIEKHEMYHPCIGRSLLDAKNSGDRSALSANETRIFFLDPDVSRNRRSAALSGFLCPPCFCQPKSLPASHLKKQASALVRYRKFILLSPRMQSFSCIFSGAVRNSFDTQRTQMGTDDTDEKQRPQNEVRCFSSVLSVPHLCPLCAKAFSEVAEHRH